MSPSSDDLVGRSLGHFRVVARVGVGGMGIVYKAFDERLHRTIALKLLPDEAIREESHRRRFLREARSAAAVSHPNVAAIHDVGEIDGRVFLAMEFVEGKTLREEIASGRLDLLECARIARGIARALAKAHEKGVVHRDLKPDNVMLNEDREVKVLDFGLAKLLEPEDAAQKQRLENDKTELFVTAEKQIVGTPSYMSPEQATGKKLDARADLFSFGILLYEMVTGKRPFRGDTPVEVLVAIVHDAPASVSSLNPRISPPFERIIDRCLLKRAEDRFGSARDLVMALEALEAGRASAADLLPMSGGTQPVTSLDGNITKRSLAPPARGASPAGWKRFAPSIAAIVGLLGVAALVTFRPARTDVAASADGGGGGTAARRAPLPDAEKMVNEGEKLTREGRRDLACDDYARASDADPTYAHAALEATLCHLDAPNDGRPFFRKAWAARGSLDERDAALLFALEPVFLREHEDDEEEAKRLDEAEKRTPNDARLHFVMAGSLRRVADGFRAIVEELDRSLAIDPQQPYALELKSDYTAYAGDFIGALAVIDQCLKIAPAAEGCLLERTWIHGLQGECGRVESDARRMLAIDPEDQDGAHVLANALYAQGRPLETAREVLRRAWDRLPAVRRPDVEREDQMHLALLAGDFTAAEGFARASAKDAAASAEMADHGRAARTLVEILVEAGRTKDAAEVAKGYLDGRDAWEPSVRLDDWALAAEPTPLMLATLLRAGVMGQAAYGAEVERTMQRWERLVEPPSRPFIWIDGYALSAETPAEAQAAMAARERFLPVPAYAPLALDEAAVGRVYLLAGRTTEALPVLREAAHSCFPLDHPIEHTRANAFLGRAQEAAGDVPAACDAYDVVRARWGSGKPRSVTGADALARSAALHCDKRENRDRPATPDARDARAP